MMVKTEVNLGLKSTNYLELCNMKTTPEGVAINKDYIIRKLLDPMRPICRLELDLRQPLVSLYGHHHHNSRIFYQRYPDGC